MKNDMIMKKVAMVRAALDEIESMLSGAGESEDMEASDDAEEEEEGEVSPSRMLMRAKLSRLRG